MSRRRKLTGAVLALVLVMTGAGCHAEPAPPGESVAPPSAAATPTADVPASPVGPVDPPTPAPEPTLRRVNAGTVTNTRSASASGSGPADIRYTRKGKFPVVARFDCSRCRGPVLLTKPGRMTPYARSSAPIEASYLTVLFSDNQPRKSMRLTATGRWKITFLSSNQLPVEKGTQSGRGSRVLFLGDRAGALGVSYRPARTGDNFNARVFGATDPILVFGNDEPFDERYDVDLPAVVAIEAKGSWTLTPVG